MHFYALTCHVSIPFLLLFLYACVNYTLFFVSHDCSTPLNVIPENVIFPMNHLILSNKEIRVDTTGQFGVSIFFDVSIPKFLCLF